MPLVKAQCTNCPGILDVDPSLKSAVCPYCGTTYIVEKAIQNYQFHIGNVQNMYAETVRLGDSTADELFKSGEAFMKFREYENAIGKFKHLSDECPHDVRGWWGLIRAYTEDLSILPDSSRCTVGTLVEYFKKVSIVSENPEEMETLFAGYLQKMIDKYKDVSEEQLTEASHLLSCQQEKIEEMKKQLQDTIKQKEQLQNKGQAIVSSRFNLILFLIFLSFFGLFLGVIVAMVTQSWWLLFLMILIVFSGMFVMTGIANRKKFISTDYHSKTDEEMEVESKTVEMEKRIADFSTALAEAQANVNHLQECLNMKKEISDAIHAFQSLGRN